MKLFATDIQRQEIERIKSNRRKQGLKQTAEKIQVMFIGTSGAVAALDQECRDGFRGSRVDWAKVMDEEEKKLLDTITRIGICRMLKNSADVLTLFSAIKENIDYLVTNDTDFEKSLKVLKKEIDTELRIIDYEFFEKLSR